MDKEKDIVEEHNEGNKWLILLTAAVNGFIIVLDFSIVNISFPRLTKVFEVSPSIVLWVSVIYSLISIGLMPILGKIGDLYGRKKVFVLGYIIFTLGLILCSLSQSMLQLILSRLIQGIGGAMNMALSFALVTDVFPSKDRGKALGILSSAFSIGPLLGMTLGGFILEILDWRAVYYTRVPICIIGIIMALVFLVEKKESTINQKLDFLGAGGLFVSLSCLLLFLNIGGRKGFASPQVLMLGVIAIILFALFIVQEIRTSQPVVDLGIFKNRVFVGGAITLVIYGLVQAAQLFLFPFYLMDGLRYSASEAGLILAVPPIFFFILAPLSGWSSDRIGPRRLCTVGIGLFFAGLFLLARLDDGATTGEIVIRFILLGIGGGVFNAPTTSLLMGAAPNNMLGSVAALANTMRVIAMSCGVAIAGVIFTVRQAFHFSQLAAQNVDPAVINQLSIIGGYRDTITLAAIVCFMGIFTSAFIGRKKRS